MILGALLDLGLPLEALRASLGSLALEYGGVSADRVLRAGVSATKFRVHAEGSETRQPRHEHGHREHERHHEIGGHDHRYHADEHHHPHDDSHRAHDHGHHSLKEIAGFIQSSALSAAGKARAVHLFERLAEAEAAIHGMPVEKVHLHEVGALDSIIDIVGAVYGLEWLGAAEILSSALNVGGGSVECAHGTFPVPAPATARLLRGAPIYSGVIAAELVTPTGALILTDYVTEFGPLPRMRIDRTGYGAGDRDFPGHPNVLRVFVGDTTGTHAAERIVSIECEIDDMNPQLFGPLMDRLYEAGALEVFYAGVQMKKNRPGTLVTVLAPPERRDGLAGVLFGETTTIGVRYQEMFRERLARDMRTVSTPVGPIRFKVATRDGRVVNASPEFDDCARAAADHGLPIKDVQAIATKAWLDGASGPR
jgi:uncharacterized protein (TIGR00299 family) protein